MSYNEYFDNTKGMGVLSTADNHGRVDAALYGRPHSLDDGSLAFVMNDRLTHANLQVNPFAVYLFVEDGKGYKGKRLFLCKTREEKNTELAKSMSRRTYPADTDAQKYVMVFKVDKELPLVGSGSFDDPR